MSMITTTKRGREPDRDAEENGIRGPVTQQAYIRIDSQVDSAELVERLRISSVSAANCIPGIENQHVFNIYFGQLVFARNDKLKNMSAGNPEIFGCLNGLDHSQYTTSEEMEEDFTFMGVSINERAVVDDLFTIHSPKKLGLGLQRGGSISIINHSRGVIRPGSLLCWKFPKFNKNIAGQHPDAEWANRIKFGSSDSNSKVSGRIVAEIEEFDPRKVDDIIKRLYRNIIRGLQPTKLANGKLQPSLFLPFNQFLDPGLASHKSLDSVSLASVSKATEVIHHLLAGLRVLQTRGIVEVITPQRKSRQDILEELAYQLENDPGSLDQDTLGEYQRRLAEVKTTNMKTDPRTQSNMTFDAYEQSLRDGRHPNAQLLRDMAQSQQRSVVRASIERAPLESHMHKSSLARKKEDGDSILWLASRLGYIDNKVSYTFGPKMSNEKWVEDIIHASFYGLTEGGDMKFKHVMEIYSPSYATASTIGNLSQMSSVDSQFETMCRISASLPQSNLAYMRHQQTKNIFSESISFAQSLQPLGVNISRPPL